MVCELNLNAIIFLKTQLKIFLSNFFGEKWQADPKTYMKIQKAKNNKDGFKEVQVRGLELPVSKTYYKATIIEIFSIGTVIEKQTDKNNGESREKPTRIYMVQWYDKRERMIFSISGTE